MPRQSWSACRSWSRASSHTEFTLPVQSLSNACLLLEIRNRSGTTMPWSSKLVDPQLGQFRQTDGGNLRASLLFLGSFVVNFLSAFLCCSGCISLEQLDADFRARLRLGREAPSKPASSELSLSLELFRTCDSASSVSLGLDVDCVFRFRLVSDALTAV
ncbi:hypothetical protein BC830DRAFT_1119411 [Chytriomyces sp. MP71]|nr:hypothetical protein BC830DRAFT_1119411 [Chytriomyces sp. MP71]